MSKYWRMLATNRSSLSLNSAYKPDLRTPVACSRSWTLVSARPCFQKTGIALSRTSSRVNSFRRPIATLSVNSTARLANKGPNGPLLQIERGCPGGPMAPSRKQQVIDLLKSLETKNPAPFAYVNPNKYIQHNLQVASGPEGVAALIQKMPSDASVNTIRVLEDGDYVFAHTQYNFFGPRIGFDIFRFEDGLIVEHWDNLQETATERSPSGHAMIDGPTAVSDLDQTQANKALMQRYMDDLLAGRRETFPSYFNGIAYIQHNPWVADTIPGLIAGLQALAAKGQAVVYKRVHMVLGEGNFVLVVAEATFGGVPTAIYDLFRIANGKIAEHWDTLEAIPPRDQWKNSNGKF